MSNTVIKIENLSKIYRLGEVGTGTLFHDLNRFVRMNILDLDNVNIKETIITKMRKHLTIRIIR